MATWSYVHVRLPPLRWKLTNRLLWDFQFRFTQGECSWRTYEEDCHRGALGIPSIFE